MVDLLPDSAPEISDLVRTLGWARSPVVALDVAGAGNMNRTYRARLEDGSSIVLKQSVDHVAKYPSIAAPAERIGVEADFYAAIAPHRELATAMPELIGFSETHRLLAMQDLGEAGAFTDVYAPGVRGPTATESAHLLRWLSALHAMDAPRDFPQNLRMRELNHEHIFVLPLQTATHEAISASLGPESLALAADIGGDAALREAAGDLGRVYLGQRAFSSRAALLHGDFYPGSWLRARPAPYVMDPEFAFVGPAEFDVGVFAAHLRFAGFGDAEVDEALSAYAAPAGFERELADAFAGIELLRRLLGVAQLPLPQDDLAKARWLTDGRRLVLAAR